MGNRLVFWGVGLLLLALTGCQQPEGPPNVNDKPTPLLSEDNASEEAERMNVVKNSRTAHESRLLRGRQQLQEQNEFDTDDQFVNRSGSSSDRTSFRKRSEENKEKEQTLSGERTDRTDAGTKMEGDVEVRQKRIKAAREKLRELERKEEEPVWPEKFDGRAGSRLEKHMSNQGWDRFEFGGTSPRTGSE